MFDFNAKFIEEENAKGHDFKLALNRFTDNTHQEFLWRRVGGFRGNDGLLGAAPLSSTSEHERRDGVLPEEKDWVEEQMVSSVKDQGSLCLSCWTFAAAGALESAVAIATMSLLPVPDYSTQDLLDCTPFSRGCKQGGIIEEAFEYARVAGLCSSKNYPYIEKDGTCLPCDDLLLPPGAITGFVRVPEGNTDLISALVQQPVAVAIATPGDRTFHFYSGRIWKGLVDCEDRAPDHAVLAVGYGKLEGKLYWKVKNSWGPTWGDEGYILFKRSDSCLDLKMGSYPLVKV